MSALRIAWAYFRAGVLNDLQYRVNFFVQLGQSIIALVVGLVGLGLVFGHTQELAGWTRPQLLTVMGVHILVGGLIRLAIQPNMERLVGEIQDGTLDHTLTKPEDAQVLVSVREVRIWQGMDAVVGAIVLAAAAAQLERRVGAWEALSFAAALVLGALMLYCFWLMLASAAFWVIRIEQIVELFQGIYAAGRWPVSVYPDWLRTGLTFLVPVAFAVTVPAEALTGRLTPQALLGAAGLTAGLLVVTRWVWGRGLRAYSGASA